MSIWKSTQRKILKHCISEVSDVAEIYIFIYSIDQIKTSYYYFNLIKSAQKLRSL